MCVAYKISDNTENTSHWTVQRDNRVNIDMYACILKWEIPLSADNVCTFFQGASSHWWNFRHFQHHAKPNKLAKDPDVHMAYLFLMGDELPKEWGAKKKGFMPYNFQHSYFFICEFLVSSAANFLNCKMAMMHCGVCMCGWEAQGLWGVCAGKIETTVKI